MALHQLTTCCPLLKGAGGMAQKEEVEHAREEKEVGGRQKSQAVERWQHGL